MTISHIQSTSTYGIAATNAGDLCIVMAAHTASTTLPTVPAGWTTITTQVQGNVAVVFAYKVMDAGEIVVPTFTGALVLTTSIYRSAAPLIINAFAVNVGVGSTATLGPLTLNAPSSWIWGGVVNRTSSSAQMSGAISGMTNRVNNSRVRAGDTNGAVSSFSSTTLAGMTAVDWVAAVIEITELPEITADGGHTTADDTVSSTTALDIIATISSVQDQDTLSSAGQLLINATLNLSDADDTLASNVALAVSATTVTLEDDDTLAASSNIVNADRSATLLATDDNDTLSSSATLDIDADASLLEDQDTLGSLATLSIAAYATMVEDDDQFTGTSFKSEAATGVVSVQEADDELLAEGGMRIAAIASLEEMNDTLMAHTTSGVVWSGTGRGGGRKLYPSRRSP